MRRIIERNYGSDIDGNRGITLTSYELDEDDTDAIINQLEDLKDDKEILSEWETIILYNPYTEELSEFEVNPSDYL